MQPEGRGGDDECLVRAQDARRYGGINPKTANRGEDACRRAGRGGAARRTGRARARARARGGWGGLRWGHALSLASLKEPVDEAHERHLEEDEQEGGADEPHREIPRARRVSSAPPASVRERLRGSRPRASPTPAFDARREVRRARAKRGAREKRAGAEPSRSTRGDLQIPAGAFFPNYSKLLVVADIEPRGSPRARRATTRFVKRATSRRV